MKNTWNAKWIWNNDEEGLVNSWLCFRKSFELSENFDEATLDITADSRYYLLINGTYAGMGPVRYWPSEIFYDTHDITQHLRSGTNTIAVLVNQYGISNFQYIQGRGGLLAQLILKSGNKEIFISTDSSWKHHIHEGYQRNSLRISCQQAWTEVYNRNKFDADWAACDYNDSHWGNCIELGKPGIPPWIDIKKRDIPLLREEPLYAARIDEINVVNPFGIPLSIYLKPYLFPEENDSNPRLITGYICSIITAPEKAYGKLHFPFNKVLSFCGNFKINDRIYSITDENPAVDISLDQGDNFFLMDISGTNFGQFAYMLWDLDKPVSFNGPLYKDCKFIVIGPFESKAYLLTGNRIENAVNMGNPYYRDVWDINDEAGLLNISDHIKPVQDRHISDDNIYISSVYKQVIRKINAFNEFNNMIIPNEEFTTILPEQEGDSEIIIDFGAETTGYIEFDIDAASGTIFDFYGFEYKSFNGRAEHTQGMHCTLRYISSEGRQTYRSLIRRGFRYLSLTMRNAARPAKIYKVLTNMSTYPVAETGRFECSDWELNKIWDISRRTTRLCMEDTFVDCPSYEQTFWIGDTRNESLVNYYTFGAYDLVARCLNLVVKSMERSPFPESHVPSGWQNVMPAWSFLWIMACIEYYTFSKDEKFIKGVYPSLVKALDGFCNNLNNTGLLELQAGNMLDWADMDTPDFGVVTHLNAELAKCLKVVSEISDSLGHKEQAEKYIEISDKVKNALNTYLWDDVRRGYVDCIHSNGTKSDVISMQTNTMVYLSGCCTEKSRNFIEEYLICPPEGFVKNASPFMSFFHFEALTKTGKICEIINSIKRDWGNMISHGATTCWETFPGFEKDRLTRSHCHAWSAAPAYFLGAYVLGVRPLEPGFKKVLIDPMLCGLKWARGSIPTIFGRIDISCETEEEKLRVKINGPREIAYQCNDDLSISFNLHKADK